jgi:hypothetical protein
MLSTNATAKAIATPVFFMKTVLILCVQRYEEIAKQQKDVPFFDLQMQKKDRN